MVVLNSEDGKILATFPIGVDTNGAMLDPSTMQAFRPPKPMARRLRRRTSPTRFVLEQTLQTIAVKYRERRANHASNHSCSD